MRKKTETKEAEAVPVPVVVPTVTGDPQEQTVEAAIATAPKEAAEVPMGVVVKKQQFDRDSWHPKTVLGKKVKAGQVNSIDEILDMGEGILEAEIVDCLLSNVETDLLAVGQSKGKFGGGKKSIWRQTQKKTPEGNKPSFAALVVVGNRNGYVGIGLGKAKETVPAREKAVRNSKLNLIKIRRGCGSWACGCGTPHSIPFKVVGKTGSVTVELIPAPKGTRLCVEKECQKILALAGIQDVYSRTYGHTGTKINLIKACVEALKQLVEMKTNERFNKKAGVIKGITEEYES